MAKNNNYKGGARERARLSYDEEWYTPAHLLSGTISEQDIKKEYSRLRSIARKRLERFENTEWTDTQVYKQNKGRYIPVKEISSKYDLAYRLSALARYITADTSSVQGLKTQRRKSLESLHSSGYTFVNKKNFNDFGKFMEDYRSKKLDRMYDSKRVAVTFESIVKKGIDPNQIHKDFELWVSHQKELENMDIRTKTGAKSHSAEEYRKELKKLDRRAK